MARIFVRGKWLTDFHLWSIWSWHCLCFSSSNGGDELLDEGFILVLFLLLYLSIMCMWCKRDLNAFFVSSSLLRGVCKINFWSMTECLQLWRFFIHGESKWCLPKTVCRLMLLPEQHQLKIFLLFFMKWMPILFAYSLYWVRLSLKLSLCIMIE